MTNLARDIASEMTTLSSHALNNEIDRSNIANALIDIHEELFVTIAFMVEHQNQHLVREHHVFGHEAFLEMFVDSYENAPIPVMIDPDAIISPAVINLIQQYGALLGLTSRDLNPEERNLAGVLVNALISYIDYPQQRPFLFVEYADPYETFMEGTVTGFDENGCASVETTGRYVSKINERNLIGFANALGSSMLHGMDIPQIEKILGESYDRALRPLMVPLFEPKFNEVLSRINVDYFDDVSPGTDSFFHLSVGAWAQHHRVSTKSPLHRENAMLLDELERDESGYAANIPCDVIAEVRDNRLQIPSSREGFDFVEFNNQPSTTESPVPEGRDHSSPDDADDGVKFYFLREGYVPYRGCNVPVTLAELQNMYRPGGLVITHSLN